MPEEYPDDRAFGTESLPSRGDIPGVADGLHCQVRESWKSPWSRACVPRSSKFLRAPFVKEENAAKGSIFDEIHFI